MRTLECINKPISDLIDEYHSGFVTGIYGNPSSGKTTTCLLALLSALKKEKKVIFIDTENSFNLDRLNQLSKNQNLKKDFLDYIFLIKPKDFYEQHEKILKLNNISKSSKIFLVIIDSLTNYYKLELNNNPKKINQLMALQIQALIRIARDQDKIVLITTQSQLDFKTNTLKMFGGKMLSNMCSVIIQLNKINDNKREAKLIKNKIDESIIGKSVFFNIKEEGIF